MRESAAMISSKRRCSSLIVSGLGASGAVVIPTPSSRYVITDRTFSNCLTCARLAHHSESGRPSSCAFSSARSRESGRMPSLLAIPPQRSSDLGDAAVHTDPPLREVEIAVVPPAQQCAVVGMGGAVVGVLGDVMDLAPG